MTPNEIITRAVQAIPGIRLPRVRMTVTRIMEELAAEGFEIREKKRQPSSDEMNYESGYLKAPPKSFGGK